MVEKEDNPKEKKAPVIKINGKDISVGENAIKSTPSVSTEEQLEILKRVEKEKIFPPEKKENVQPPKKDD